MMKKIFVVDDDVDILQIISMMLTKSGYDVVANTDPDVLFEDLSFLPDIILLDIWMSGVDGRDICAKVKSDERLKHIPIIFVSANSDLPQIAEEFEVAFLSKPFDMYEMVEKVEELIL